jgi:membrane protein DedA with SNARE-associated domain
MASLDQWLQGLFAFLGPSGIFLGLFLLFVIDAAVFPALPEIAIVVAYLYGVAGYDPFVAAVLLLAVALVGELAGNTLLYAWVRRLLVDRGRLPRWIERAMEGWTRFLVFPDERIILLNRVAPVLPFVGAFIAVLRWSFPKSLGYILIGAVAKYSLLLILVGSLRVAYSRQMATLLTVSAVLVLVLASLISAYLLRRRQARVAKGT